MITPLVMMVVDDLGNAGVAYIDDVSSSDVKLF